MDYFYPPSGTILGLRRKTGAKGLHLACVLCGCGRWGWWLWGEGERDNWLMEELDSWVVVVLGGAAQDSGRLLKPFGSTGK